MRINRYIAILLLCGAALVWAGGSTEESERLNIYSHRHYDSDRELFDRFEEIAGIEILVVKADADQLIERLRQEGDQSPADILITVDAGRLHRAKEAGVLQAVTSDTLEAQVPDHLHDEEGYWWALTKRARVIVYSKDRVDAGTLTAYEDLADPRFSGRVVVRSSTNIYNQSLLASTIAHLGHDAAVEWARGVSQNFARDPKGNDRDQIKAIAAGVADVGLVNSYYYGLMLESDDAAEREAADLVGIVNPNQEGRGTHINVSGAGVTTASDRVDLAIRFLEYLTSPEAQAVFAGANHEYPVNPDADPSDLVAGFGLSNEDRLPLEQLGEMNAEAVAAFAEAGWR